MQGERRVAGHASPGKTVRRSRSPAAGHPADLAEKAQDFISHSPISTTILLTRSVSCTFSTRASTLQLMDPARRSGGDTAKSAEEMIWEQRRQDLSLVSCIDLVRHFLTKGYENQKCQIR